MYCGNSLQSYPSRKSPQKEPHLKQWVEAVCIHVGLCVYLAANLLTSNLKVCESATRCGCLNATSFVSVYLITAVVTWKQVNDDFHFDYEHWLIQLALTLPCTHSMSICCLLLVLYCYSAEWEWVHCSSHPFLKTVILYNLGNLGYHHCFDDAPSIHFLLLIQFKVAQIIALDKANHFAVCEQQMNAIYIYL